MWFSPIVRELDTRLISLDQCEDVILGAVEDTLEDCQIAHDACQ